jgi:hypothetical protein
VRWRRWASGALTRVADRDTPNFRLPVPRFIEGSISCTAEKVGAIELIHLPESLHFVELEVAGKPDYYADQLDIPLGLFLAPRRAQ